MIEKVLTIIVFLVFVVYSSFGQRDTIFLDWSYKVISGKHKALYFLNSKHQIEESNYLHEIYDYKNGSLRKRIISKSDKFDELLLNEEVFSKNGKLMSECKILTDSTDITIKYDVLGIPLYKMYGKNTFFDGEGIWFDKKGDTLTVVEYKKGLEYNGLFPFESKEMQFVNRRVNEYRFRSVINGKVEKIIYKYLNGNIAVEEYAEYHNLKFRITKGVYYYQNGDLIGECEFSNGKPNSGIQAKFSNKHNHSKEAVKLGSISKLNQAELVEYTTLDVNEKIISHAKYVDSEIDQGSLYKRNKDYSQYMRLMHFKDGIHIGTDSIFSLSGQLLMEVEINNESLDGNAKVYSIENGEIIHKGIFKNNYPYNGILYAINRKIFQSKPNLIKYEKGEETGDHYKEDEFGKLKLIKSKKNK